jgi:hypothetical protein
MARYQVPQFIEVEDKIFGPLTFKQFVYLVGSGGFAFMIIKIFPLFIALIIVLPIVGLGLALAFYKVNNKPFILSLEAAFRYVLSAKLYIWKKEKKSKEEMREETVERSQKVRVPKLSGSKLEDLAWGLDINELVD